MFIRRLSKGTTPRHNFHILDYHHILSLNTSVMTLKHDHTGHTFVHLERDDPHMSHGIALRTPVSNDTGIPHILEHLSLCGSEKYAVRDPFFKMLNRSMATYMNAWTAADYTFYPFSTENATDYRNLRDIYADAVFRPLLREGDFLQEGWRLDAQNKCIKGVVYNEMKGALSEIDSLFLHQLNRTLYAGTCYEFNSGGDPQMIPQLSLRELREYHARTYTPANSLTVCYGNVQLEEQLKFLDEMLPRDKSTELINPTIQSQLHSWKKVRVEGPLDPSLASGKQTRYLRAWLCNDVKDVQETFDLKLLSSLLLDGPAAPLHQALLESNLGTDYAPGTGYDASSSITSFGIGLQGATLEDVPKIESLILICLERVAKEGFSKERVEGVLHQMSLSLRYHSVKFGLNAAATIASAWAHGVDLSEALDVDERIKNFETGCLGTDRLQKLIRKYLLDNPRGVDFVMTPREEYNAELQRKESIMVQEIIASKSKEELSEIERKNEELQKDRVDDYDSVLPMLTEMPPTPRHLSIPFVTWPVPTTSTKAAVIKERYAHSSPLSNKVTFLKLLGIQKMFRRDDLPYLPLAMNALTELGIRGMTTEAYENLVRKTCAGLSASAYLHHDKGKDDLRLLLSTWALDEKTEATKDLLSRTIAECNWQDGTKVRTLIGQMAADALGGVASNGHRYAALKAAAQFGAVFQDRDSLSGLDQVFFLQSLLKAVQVDENLSQVCKKLQSVVQNVLLGSEEWRSAVTRTHDAHDIELKDVLNRITAIDQVNSEFRLSSTNNQNATFPFNSNYVGVAYFWPGHATWTWEQKAAWLLFSGILRSKVLHPLVREQGGAYGSSASMDTRLGLFTLTSYRDPTPALTLELYRDLPALFNNVTSVAKEKEGVVMGEARLGVLQGLDAPVDLAQQGLHRFRGDMEDAHLASLRAAVLQMDAQKMLSLVNGMFSDFKGPAEHVINAAV